MKDVDRLLTTAFLDELERTPPAPVNKRALRDRTFEKLGLERQAPRAEWAQAVTVPRWRSLGGGRLPGGRSSGERRLLVHDGDCPGPGLSNLSHPRHLPGVRRGGRFL